MKPDSGMDMDPGDMIYDMQMTFGFGIKAGWVLFENFKVEDAGQFTAALALVLAMAILTEGLSFIMWWQKLDNPKSDTDKKIGQKLVSGLLYFLLRFLNYCQMLVAMTFNFWIILSIALF